MLRFYVPLHHWLKPGSFYTSSNSPLSPSWAVLTEASPGLQYTAPWISFFFSFLGFRKCITMRKHIHLFNNYPLVLWNTTLPACLPNIKLSSWKLLSFIEEYMTDWLNGLHRVKHIDKRFVRKGHGGCVQIDAGVTGEKENVNILEGHKVTMRIAYWPSSPWMLFFHTWCAARSTLLFNTYRVGFVSVIRCTSQRQSYAQVCSSHTAHNGCSESRQRLSP